MWAALTERSSSRFRSSTNCTAWIFPRSWLHRPRVQWFRRQGSRLVGPLPYADGTFNIIFSGETIEHQLDTDWLLLEFNRVLKPGGQLVLTFPNIRTPLGIAMLLFLDMPPMYAARYRAGHFRDFTLRIIKLALVKHGFRHEKSYGTAFYLPKIGECWAGLASILPSWSHQVVTVSTKIENSRYTPKDLITDSHVLGS